MDTASSLLIKVLKKRGLHKHAIASLVVTEAGKWLEEQLPDYKEEISVKSLKDGSIHIECTHSIAAQELHAVSEDLKEYLQKMHNNLELEGIRILRK